MLWCEVRVRVPVADIEVVAEVMRVVAPGGVSIEEPLIILGPEEGALVDTTRPASVTCYLLVDDRLGAQVDTLRMALAAADMHPEIETRRADDAEWADAWKEHFHVTHVGERTVIRPSWRDYTPQPREVVIDLDPGMAFGTGQHESTRGSLAMLEQTVLPGMQVLDAGTGSGILAIAAVKLGAAGVLAVDSEPQAITVTRENAERNGVAAQIQVAHGSLGAAWPHTAAAEGWADLVVANIHARVLLELAPQIIAALRPGGSIILSGIIADREDDVRAAYQTHGYTQTARIADGEWRTLHLAATPPGQA